MRDNSFVPATVTVTAGDTVTWTQSGANPHSVTADDGSFDSHPNCLPACMSQGDTFSHTFEEPGEFGYHCKVHGAPGEGMAGTVVVEAAGDQPEEEPEQEPDTTDEPAAEEEPDTTDEPAAEDEPDTTGEPADPAAQADETAAAEQDPADAAEDGEQLADTGGRWALLPVGLALLAGGALTVRRGRSRMV